MLGAERFDDTFGVARWDTADDQATAGLEYPLHLFRIVRDGFGVDVGDSAIVDKVLPGCLFINHLKQLKKYNYAFNNI